jgi:transcriptional regulator
MYVPAANRVEDEATVRAMVAAIGSAQVITVGPDGFPAATLLPILWEGDTVVAHMARANGHWRTIEPGSPALFVVTGALAYVSPGWYPTKAVDGRVVPTWNYSAVHLVGRLVVHDDPAWVLDVVTRLTERNERTQAQPWAVTDAPESYVSTMLRGIVGIELTVEHVEAKAKLSQNRSDADRAGVVTGLRGTGRRRDEDVAADMELLGHQPS